MAISIATTRLGLLSTGSYVAPSPQRCIPCKRHETELTYCPVYGFKSPVFSTKGLTPALFCGLCLRRARSRRSGDLQFVDLLGFQQFLHACLHVVEHPDLLLQAGADCFQFGDAVFQRVGGLVDALDAFQAAL